MWGKPGHEAYIIYNVVGGGARRQRFCFWAGAEGYDQDHAAGPYALSCTELRYGGTDAGEADGPSADQADAEWGAGPGVRIRASTYAGAGDESGTGAKIEAGAHAGPKDRNGHTPKEEMAIKKGSVETPPG